MLSAESARDRSWTPIGPADWFYNQVKNGGDWDYKQQAKRDGKNYEAFGNFNFGATALALRIWDEQTILREAGSTVVNLRERSAKLKGKDLGILILKGQHKFDVVWDGNTRLRLQCRDCRPDDIFKQEKTLQNIEISFVH